MPPILKHLAKGLVLLIAFLWCAQAGGASPPRLLKDFNTSRAESYKISHLCRVSQTVFFFMGDQTHGVELWRTDGTSASMRLVKDITPGTSSSEVKAVCASGSWLFFLLYSNQAYELWKSDGTAGGTTKVHRFASLYWPYLQPLMLASENCVFLHFHLGGHIDLWRTDGSSAGTFMLRSFPTMETLNAGLTTSGGQLFMAINDGVNGHELWKSDGTVAGTTLVKDIRTGAASSWPKGLTAMNGWVYFSAYDDSGNIELWRSDGTTSGTSKVKDIHGPSLSSSPEWLTAGSGYLYFTAVDSSGNNELWRTDGTDGGTVSVWDSGTTNRYSILNLAFVGGVLYFSASQPATAQELWKSDGTPSGTRMVKDIAPGSNGSGPRTLTAAGNRVFFTAWVPETGVELYVSSGTAAGTRMVKDFWAGDPYGTADINHITALGDSVLFTAYNETHGRQIWKSDGSTTTMLLPPSAVSSTAGTDVSGSVAVGDTMYFSVSGETSSNGLWKTDGTTSGTRLVKGGGDLYFDGNASPMAEMGGRIFFVRYDSSEGMSELWRSDGTAAGTSVLDGFATTTYLGKGISNLKAVGSLLFFTVNTDEHGIELWCTEGKAGTTRLVRDINAGTGSSTPMNFHASGDMLYFTADDGIHGREMWTSDGTETGTRMVRDILPGTGSSIEAGASGLESVRIVQIGVHVCFAAKDDSHGTELWRSDGTEAGTLMVTDLHAGPPSSVPNGLTAANGRIYFTAYTTSTGLSLWSTDGTEAGTSMAWKPPPGSPSTSMENLTATDSGLCFSINHSELWASDGTESGTRLLKTMAGWKVDAFMPVDGLLFFSGTTLEQGTELWRTDGTESGTTMVSDLAMDSGSSNALPFGRTGSHFLFLATTERYGRELWVLEHGQQPGLMVTGNGKVIRNGDLSPDTKDYTDFASSASGDAPRQHLFVIRNTTTGTMTLKGPLVTISGPHASDFVLTSSPKAVLAAGESTSFQIGLHPSQNGLRTAAVHLVANEGFNTRCSFAIQGHGGALPLKSQTISFQAPTQLLLKPDPVPLLAWTSSGLPVKLEIFRGPASLNGHALTTLGEGWVIVRATQPGDNLHRETAPVYRFIEVLSPNSSGGMFEGFLQIYDGHPKPVSWAGSQPPTQILYQVGGIKQSTPPVDAGAYPVIAKFYSMPDRHGTLVIQRVPLFVEADDKRKFAGQVNPPLTTMMSGFVNSETAIVLKTQPVVKTTATKSSPGGTYSIQSSGGSATNYTLIHRPGTMLVETFAGAYESLLSDSTVLPSGKVSILVPASNGSFTGKLQLREQGSVMPISGNLVIDPVAETATATATANASVRKSGTEYQISIVLNIQGGMNGYVLGAGAIAVGTTTQGIKISNRKALYAGTHTLVLEPALPAGPGIPAGAGWAACNILSNGTLALAGKLPDGTSFSTSLSPDDSLDPGYRLFLQPYVPTRSQSVLCGTFSLQPHPSLTARRYVSGAELSWSKAGMANDSSYVSGFGPVKTIMTLDPWQKPSSTTALKSLLGISQTISISHSATGSPSDAQLPTQLLLTGDNNLTVQSPLPNITRWNSRVDTAKGTFTGSFELLDGTVKRTAPFNGVLRQPPATGDTVVGEGHFLLPPLPSNPATGKVSGEVLLQR